MSKITWFHKLLAFAASVMTLSWFFAGWRQVNEVGGPGDWALLAGGTILTLLLLGLQGYWAYFEEKEKGTLRRRVVLFEKIHDAISDKDSGGSDSKKLNRCAQEAHGA